MHYMFLIYGNEEVIAQESPEEMAANVGKNQRVVEEAMQQGAFVGVGALQPTATATTVRTTGGKALMTDGPFAETKEQLGGYYILDCANLDEAIAWASKMPSCGDGCIEIRPMLDLSGGEA